MTRSSLTLLGSAVTWLVLLTGSAHADFIDYGYNWSRTPNTGVIIADPGGTGGLTLTDEPTKTASGSSDIVATNLRTFSSADPKHPDTLTHKAFTLTLTLTDTMSGQTGSMTFHGEFNGSFSASSSNIKATFLGATSDSMMMGTAATGFRMYTVTFGSYSPPGPPSATNAGSIGAHVDVASQGSGGGHHMPEPSTVVLSLMGLSCAGLASWRKWRARGAVNAA
jgi:hypothetical protein